MPSPLNPPRHAPDHRETECDENTTQPNNQNKRDKCDSLIIRRAPQCPTANPMISSFWRGKVIYPESPIIVCTTRYQQCRVQCIQDNSSKPSCEFVARRHIRGGRVLQPCLNC